MQADTGREFNGNRGYLQQQQDVLLQWYMDGRKDIQNILKRNDRKRSMFMGGRGMLRSERWCIRRRNHLSLRRHILSS